MNDRLTEYVAELHPVFSRSMNRALYLLPFLLLSCDRPVEREALCKQHFTPYPDMISGQVRDARNSPYLDAMAHYAEGDYEAAAIMLQHFIEERREAPKSALIYLASCHLAIGNPFEAELALDKLENSTERGFADQCEWYTTLCWLCSGQWERARSGAEAIAGEPQHTYKHKAALLAEELESTESE